MLTFENFMIFLNWTAPFTLLGTPTYCVDVVNSINMEALDSECGINMTEFTYPFICEEISFTVTPVNMAGNGTVRTISTNYTSVLPEVAEVLSVPTRFLLVDVDTGETITLRGTVVETNITFTTEQLSTNCHYTITITAFNVAGTAISRNSISK